MLAQESLGSDATHRKNARQPWGRRAVGEETPNKGLGRRRNKQCSLTAPLREAGVGEFKWSKAPMAFRMPAGDVWRKQRGRLTIDHRISAAAALTAASSARPSVDIRWGCASNESKHRSLRCSRHVFSVVASMF